MIQIASKFVATSFYGKVIKARAFNPLHPRRRTYCHTEIVFSDGLWFSAREIGNSVKFLKGCPDDPKFYDYISLPVSDEDEVRLRAWCEDQMVNDDGTPCGYDVKAIVFQFLPVPINWQSPTDWFCTEIVCAAVQTLGYLPGYAACGMMPTEFHYLMEGK